ncbi:MAG: hypothetical protein HY261_08030 [Chloroflexi bacterium]|nr:hypothetical protein [Chloroflexota bacterium]
MMEPREIHRRDFVKTTIGAASTAMLGDMLAARRAPAVGQTITLQLLHAISFIPESDAELRRQLGNTTSSQRWE